MDAELTALASAGATLLVQLMPAENWAAVKQRVAEFLGDSADDLEAARAELLSAQEAEDGELVQDLAAEWRARIKRKLRTDPASAVELRALLDELLPQHPGVDTATYNTISGGVQHGTVIQAGNVSGANVNVGHTPVENTPPGPDFGDDDEW